jgi:hypothetical protein
MSALSKAVLLFALNWLDAQLTIIWVRAQLATEGNGLMAWLLDIGDGTFLGAKLLIGAFAAFVLYRCSHLKLARGGMTLALSIYFGIMFVHAVTGMSALGWHAPETVLAYLSSLPNSLLAVFS